jgi:hypothetical protein
MRFTISVCAPRTHWIHTLSRLSILVSALR